MPTRFIVNLTILVSMLAGISPAQAATAKLVSVAALSQHRLLATFDREPGGAALDPGSYTINTPGGSLALTAVSAAGNMQALMSTGVQQAVGYQISGPARNATPVAFTGSTIAEPRLLGAVSTSPSRVVLTFSEPMGVGATNCRQLPGDACFRGIGRQHVDGQGQGQERERGLDLVERPDRLGRGRRR